MLLFYLLLGTIITFDAVSQFVWLNTVIVQLIVWSKPMVSQKGRKIIPDTADAWFDIYSVVWHSQINNGRIPLHICLLISYSIH